MVAAERSVVARVSAARLDDLAEQFPQIHRHVAQELAKRLYQRNDHIGSARDRTKVLVLAAPQADAAAQVVQETQAIEGFVVRYWQEGLVRSGGLSVQRLQELAAGMDFAVVIPASVVATASLTAGWPDARAEVLLETGVLLGVLGSERTVLLEARGDDAAVDDLPGVVNVAWLPDVAEDLDVVLAPACTRLRRYFEHQGPFAVA